MVYLDILRNIDVFSINSKRLMLSFNLMMQLTLERIKVIRLYQQIEHVYLHNIVNIICYDCHYLSFYGYDCCFMANFKRIETKKKAKDEFARVMIGVEFDMFNIHLIIVYTVKLLASNHICRICVCCDDNKCKHKAFIKATIIIAMQPISICTFATSFQCNQAHKE